MGRKEFETDMECEKYDFLKINSSNHYEISVSNYKDKRYMWDKFYVFPNIQYTYQEEREFYILVLTSQYKNSIGFTLKNVTIKSNVGNLKINNSFLESYVDWGGEIKLHDIKKSDKHNRNYEKVKKIFMNSENVTLEIDGSDYKMSNRVVKDLNP